ncbi:cell division ATP-binding protein FtsE [Mergibacter septicus]|uniref:Cell division ATP-binding protein FtsE n=1 Tax=Mergibacter septicus TaxID=221402 RepID=A0A8D4J3D6_9PAST|nr:cell division ATP-binding protein FtsE [Mergibacter septicus]AWX16155.1 cell division ATP-binding protein FtsE [Mergibacter septicus]QDJ13609.1 cell division ATP-binding protein FtsE [Mergibacter septicus]QDJ15407.1 cell division ATP-binding protein FtsE [Mergibacter septicus]UTU48721.1 cell division ATP-binding protein FtsE [Mergibacter septicus]WMR95646.1 cell division ATP-binding protein FtsE [Mergibacter septicus]
MIRFVNVSKAYSGGKQALQGIDFRLPAGGISYLTGHSGAGKSTLLKLILGIEKANAGQIYFNGQDISRPNKAELPFLRRQIGMVHQDYRLLNDRTVLENVALPLIISGIHPHHALRRAAAALDRVGLHQRREHSPQYLSGGEQQRIEIARAIVAKPQLLLADEPTGNLDHDLSMDIFQLFEELNYSGMTILIATHNQQIIQQKPHLTLVLKQGRLQYIGSSKGIGEVNEV